MKRKYIKELKPGERSKISGWVDKIREQKTMVFVVLRDRTGKVQITIEKDKQKGMMLYDRI